MQANSLPQVADSLSAVTGGGGEGRRRVSWRLITAAWAWWTCWWMALAVSRSCGERAGMSASSSD